MMCFPQNTIVIGLEGLCVKKTKSTGHGFGELPCREQVVQYRHW